MREQGPNPEVQREQIAADIRLLFSPISTGESADDYNQRLADREQASSNLAQQLADPHSGVFTADTIVSLNETLEDIPDHAVSVYWGIVKKAQETTASMVPITMLALVQELAQDEGETDIAFEAMMLASEVGDVAVSDRADVVEGELDDSVLQELTAATQRTLAELRERNASLLSDLKTGKVRLLDMVTDQNAQTDKARLANRSGRPMDLLADINHGRFLSPEGLELAKAQHDAERLKMRLGRPIDLLSDINNGRFTTAEGYAAATIRHDSERLRIRSGRPVELLQDVLAGRFKTAEGLIIAKQQQDTDRLAMRRGRPAELKGDLTANRFLTQRGIMLAKQILNNNA
ncbi:MAG: hypothetical protein JWS12_499 [Candidatus Saccharibacteria bacterium]|nr:hypothetical protein [Candidatus Saccharibacteria bacterium]